MMFKCMEGSYYTHAYSFVAMWDAKSPYWSIHMNPMATGLLTLLSCTEKTQLHMRLRSPNARHQSLTSWQTTYQLMLQNISQRPGFQLKDSRSDVFFKTGFLNIFGWYTSRIQVYGKSPAVLSALSLQFASSCSHLSHEDSPVFLMSFAGNMGFSWGHWNSVCPCL